jgi:hypothetical protein
MIYELSDGSLFYADSEGPEEPLKQKWAFPYAGIISSEFMIASQGLNHNCKFVQWKWWIILLELLECIRTYMQVSWFLHV